MVLIFIFKLITSDRCGEIIDVKYVDIIFTNRVNLGKQNMKNILLKKKPLYGALFTFLQMEYSD